MTPTRFIGKCHFCYRPLDMREPGVHQYTSGWVKNRQGGGGHGISLPKRENLWAHGGCVDSRARGTQGQAQLFDAPPSKLPPAEPEPTNASFDERGMFMHVCNRCGADAPFGVGVAIKKGDLGLWYCKRHLPPPYLD